MVDGQVLSFDLFGLFQDVFTMTDRQTGTLWTHLDGKAIRGPLEGKRLTIVPAPQMTWAQWVESRPDTTVLSPDTPFSGRYRQAQIGRYNPSEDQYGDDRLPANALVVGVEVDGQFKGYPADALHTGGGVVNDTLAGQPVVVVYDSIARTGLAYSRRVAGQTLEFYNAAALSNEATGGVELRDRETGSRWKLQGGAVSGPLVGESLTFVSSFISEWYGWSAYHPESTIYAGEP